jgi:hypothetical protein
MMVVLAVICVVVGIIVPTVTNVLPSSKASLADTNTNILNQSVLKHNQVTAELAVAAVSDGTDEQSVASALQTRDAASPGSPFLSPGMSMTLSSDANTYRAVWNGRMFEVLSPGSTGTGLDLLRMTEAAP